MISLVSLLTGYVYAQVVATYHDYEGDRQTLGRAYDNSPGWCGIRYSVLNVARITAVNGLSESLCNQCLEVQNANGGPLVYVLAVDQKQGPGLDIARTSYAALTPGANPLDPQQVRYRVVSPSFCAGICQGSAEECTPGRRNLLPANLLPSAPFVQASYGGPSSSAPTVSQPRANQPAFSQPSTPPTTTRPSENQPVANNNRPQTRSSRETPSPQVTRRPSVSVTVTEVASSTATEQAEPTFQIKYGSLPEPIYGVFEQSSSALPLKSILTILALFIHL